MPSRQPSREGVLAAISLLDGGVRQLAGAFVADSAVSVFATREMLFANLTPSNDALAVVYADDGDKIGLYVKRGISGTGYWLPTGLMLRGEAGPLGEQGRSLYDIAVETGYIPASLPEEKFVEYIIGDIVVAAQAAADTATVAADDSRTAAASSKGYRDQAIVARNDAQFAASTVTATTGYFPTRAAGEAGTPVGKLFSTKDAGNNLLFYERTAGGSTPITFGAYATLAGIQTLSGKTFAGKADFLLDGSRLAITSAGTGFTPEAIVDIINDDAAGIGLQVTSRWTGGAGTEYQNHDTTLFNVFNRTLTTSFNRSWAVSASNAYHDVAEGVEDTGTRVGVLGWAPSVNGRPGYEHRGTLSELNGVMGTSGFQGVGFPSAVIRDAIGVRGLVYADSPGSTIEAAFAGSFVSDGLGLDGTKDTASTILRNYGIYARAQGGTQENWVFYGEKGRFYNQDPLFTPSQYLAGTQASQTGAGFSARKQGNNFEFGNDDPAGFGSTLGSTFASGLPFLAFNAECDPANDTFRTRGKKGVVVWANGAGDLIIGRLLNANAAGQTPREVMRVTRDGHVYLDDPPVYPDNAAARAAGLIEGTIYTTATGEMRVVRPAAV